MLPVVRVILKDKLDSGIGEDGMGGVLFDLVDTPAGAYLLCIRFGPYAVLIFVLPLLSTHRAC